MARHSIVYFPDYTAGNPYQALLYRHLAHSLTAQPGTVHDALWRQTTALDEGVIFHLHWEDAVYGQETDEENARGTTETFIGAITTFIERGGVFVWTIHNIAPHDRRFADLHSALCRKLSSLAHRVHLHSLAAINDVARRFNIDPGKTLVIPHGNYCPVVGSPRARRNAREALGYTDKDVVFLLFGRLLKYKGGDDLIKAFSMLDAEQAKLVIAGKQVDKLSLAPLADHLRDDVVIRDGFQPLESLVELLHGADFAVLPYRATLTSGSVLLAFSAGVPVIVPRFRTLEDLAVQGKNALLFEPNDTESLCTCLRKAVALDETAIGRMSKNAQSTAHRFDWDTIGEQFSAMFVQAITEVGLAREAFR